MTKQSALKYSINTLLMTLLISCGAADNSKKTRNNDRGSNNDQTNGEQVFSALERSMITRSAGVARLSYTAIKTQLKKGSLPTGSGYYQFPEAKMKEPIRVSEVGADEISESCGVGESQTIAQKIADCQETIKLKSAYSWDGKNGIFGEGNWTLISYVNEKKVWLDTSTGLLWSDIIAQAQFTEALGRNPDDSTQITSLCTANKDAPKDELGKTTPDKVSWRMPNKAEVLQAYLNGAGNVLSKTDSIWTATYITDTPEHTAWSINETTGEIFKTLITESLSVRCVGVILE